MSRSDKEESDARLRARLEELRAALQKQEEERREQKSGAPAVGGPIGRAMSVGFTVLSEFVAAILVGAAIGWQADAWFGTKPWLLVLFLGLGVAAGFWNVFRLSTPQGAGDEERSERPDSLGADNERAGRSRPGGR